MAAVVVAAAIPSAAEAQNRVTARFGHWTVYEGRATDNVRQCGALASGEGRALSVKVFPDTRTVFVSVVKRSWSIPAGTEVSVALQFDGHEPFVTSRARGEGKTVGFLVRRDNAAEFLAQFAVSSSGVIRFGGSETPWSIDLTGSAAAFRAMMECSRRRQGEEGGGATQPFAATPPPPPAPTQPFAPGPAAEGPRSGGVPPVGTGRERRT